jgi:predicted nucleotidyltransferase
MDFFKITKSKTREKILQLFFADVDKKYYLRELERILNLPVGNIRRELLSLEKAGFFNHEKMGKQVYYSLNKNAAVFKEFKSIILKTIGVAGTLKRELEKIKGIKKSFIFGSFAKNQEDSSSDVDLMIVGNNINEDLLISKISKLEILFRREVNYHLFDEKEWKEKAKTESFLKSVINGPKIEII